MAVNAELKAFATRVATVTRPEELFGADIDHHTLKKLYRQFAKVAHADRYIVPTDKRLAHEAFTRLTALYHEADERFALGKYGTNEPTRLAQITTKRTTYTITRTLTTGDLAIIYQAKASDDTPVYIKLARDRRDNDLLDAEAKALSTLQDAAKAYSFRFYLPALLESFRTTSGAVPGRAANVFAVVPRYVPLTDVIARYPKGVDPRHAVWMFNRLLSVLGFVHEQGIVHGAVLPPHLLINPDNHGLMLIDWCFAVKHGETVKAISEPYRAWYPPEILRKRAVTNATDLFMAARAVSWVMGDGAVQIPTAFRRFLDSCLLSAQSRRADDAFALGDAFRKLAEAMYGKRKFVRLEFA